MTEEHRTAIFDIMNWLGAFQRWVEEDVSIGKDTIHYDTVRAYLEAKQGQVQWDKPTQDAVVRFLSWCDGGDCLNRGPYNPYGEYIHFVHGLTYSLKAYVELMIDDFERDVRQESGEGL